MLIDLKLAIKRVKTAAEGGRVGGARSWRAAKVTTRAASRAD